MVDNPDHFRDDPYDDGPELGLCGCDDYTPAMHDGVWYCEACDADIPPQEPTPCANPKPDSFLTGHIMRLEKSDGERERWRCTRCGHEEIRPFPFKRKEPMP